MSTGWMRALGALAVLIGLTACGDTVEPADQTATSGAGGGAGGDAASTSATTSGGDAGGASDAGGGGAGGGCYGEGGAGGGGEPTCDGPGARFVTRVISACFGDGQTFGLASFPENVYGPPKGAGCCMGSLDVVSLGNGGTITLAFEGNAIVDGPGVDFLVFENAFSAGGDATQPYAELATVEVSADGVEWHAFPCTATSFPYGSCAGWHPVYANADDGAIDPLDPAAAGGDPFDLADLGVPLARFVRITDRPDLPTVFDLDAVGIVHAACP